MINKRTETYEGLIPQQAVSVFLLASDWFEPVAPSLQIRVDVTGRIRDLNAKWFLQLFLH